MLRRKKFVLIGIISLIAIAFAAVTTTLVLNGNLAIGTNDDDYAIYFSKSYMNSEDVSKGTISSDGQSLIFDAKMNHLGESKKLEYEVTNASKNYDAKVSVECDLQDVTEEDTGLSVDDYLNIEYSSLDEIIEARSTATGSITMTLKKSMIDKMNLGLNCKLSFEAVERESLATVNPDGLDASEYTFKGFLVDKNDEIVRNVNIVILGTKKQYITSGEEDADLTFDGLDMGFHTAYIMDKSIEEIKTMSDDEIKESALAKATFTQSSKKIEFDNGYKILDELVKKEHVITFDTQGGTVTPKKKTVIYRGLYGSLPIPKLSGYTFKGWYLDTENIDEIKENTKVDLKSDATIYAKWEANTYNVNFNSNGGNNIASKKVKFNGTYGELVTPERARYNFKGWYLEDTLITEITRYTIAKDVTLVAKWEAKKKNVTTVVDEINGGVIVDLTKPIVESLTSPSKVGYTFIGWYKDDDSKLNDDEYLDEDEELKIHAKFKANTYKVNFNGNTGSVSTLNKDVIYDNNYGELPIPSKAGYNFIGWFTDKKNGEQVTSDIIVKITDNQELYAHWVAKDDIVYTVKHWKQKIGAQDIPRNEENYTIASTESFVGTTDTEVKPNTKTFEGFTSPEMVSVKVLADGSAEVNYYYTRNAYYLTVNKDVGVLEVNHKVKYQYDEDVNVGYTIKDGYTFANITGDKTSNKFSMPAEEITININTTENVYTITYELNDGVVSKTNPTTYKVTSEDITLNNPSRKGYTFTGWTGSNGSEKEQNVTLMKGSTGNKSYTANFIPNTYSINFDANGGSEVLTILTVTYDATYGDTLPTPTLIGYTFDGWFTELTGGKQITSTTKVDISENTTLYAHWTINSYDVTLDVSGKGTVDPTLLSVNYGSSSDIQVTPGENSYLNEITCNNGYTASRFEASKSATDSQIVTISNNNVLEGATCSIKYKSFCEYEPGKTWTFSYTGHSETFTSKCEGNYRIELWGAQGGNSATGGKGAYTAGTITLGEESLFIYVGGHGYGHGGYNGGGSPSTFSGFEGGGSTDIRKDSNNLYSRIMVAAGGSGSSTGGDTVWNNGVPGGGLIGYDGLYSNYNCTSHNQPVSKPAGGATQISGGTAMICVTGSCMHGSAYAGSFFYGARDNYPTNGTYGSGGGGSGWYGGGGGTTTNCNITSSASGSSYISGHIGAIGTQSPTSHVYDSKCISSLTLECSKSYTGYVFTDTKMIDGYGYSWTTSKGNQINMPNITGNGTMTGKSGDGYAKITYLGE